MGRRLGQHFLFDPAILDRIVAALDPEPHDWVLEIGPGRGPLTRRLVHRVARVICIERDVALAEALRAEDIPGVEVRTADALDVDWTTLAERPLKVVGNVPYAITTPLVDRALRPPMPPVVVFLVQREVGDRLAAEPRTKAYGALTVGVQTVARVERLFAVRAGSFRPPPKVESVVIRMTPREDPPLAPEDRARFRRFVNALFAQRRKQLVGTLRRTWGLTAAEAEAILVGLDLDPRNRPEVLTPHEFVRLFQAVPR